MRVPKIHNCNLDCWIPATTKNCENQNPKASFTQLMCLRGTFTLFSDILTSPVFTQLAIRNNQ